MKTLRQHYAAARSVMKDYGYRSSFPSGGRPPRERRKKGKKGGMAEVPEPLYLTTPRAGKEPKRLPGSPTRPWMRHPHQKNSFGDQGERLLVYALSVLRVVERYDRTGWAKVYLYSSDDVCSEVWRQIPDVLVCPYCLGRVCGDAVLPGRKVFCRPCGDYVRPKNLRGLVAADLRKMRRALRAGEIPTRMEAGERE